MSTEGLTMLERMRIQMEYVVPLVRDLQALLGTDVVNDALARRDTLRTRSAPGSKADFTRMSAGAEMFAEGGALEYQVIASDHDSFDMDVRRCGYAEMMDELDARDLGHLLICSLDYPAADRLGMDLARSQTLMQGGSRCDFRYRRKP